MSLRSLSWRYCSNVWSTQSVIGRVLVLVAGLASAARAQSMDDAIFMDKRVLCAGLVYTRDQWTDYWEGSLKRNNGNIGTLTTNQVTWMGAYGVTRRINIMASLPYVQTRASAGVLAGQSGSQDLSVGIKFNALSTPLTAAGTLHVVGVLSATVPTTDYTPDFYPMSIGSHSRRATARGILSFQSHRGLYMNGSASYTRRGNVTVDFTRIDGGVQYQLPMLRVGAPASALPDSLLADEGRSRAGAIHCRRTDSRTACDRAEVERRRRHVHTARTLERHRGRADSRCAVQ